MYDDAQQVLNQYLAMLAEQQGDGDPAQASASAKSFSEVFSGWLEEKGIIGYNR